MKLFRKLKLYLDPIRFQYLKLCPVKLSKGTFVLSNYLFRTTLELGTVIICTYLLSDLMYSKTKTKKKTDWLLNFLLLNTVGIHIFFFLNQISNSFHRSNQ